jgi:hypothetical protein
VIRGRFSVLHPNIARRYNPDHPPVPLINVRLWVPELGELTEPFALNEVTLLVDTGADMTILHPQDSQRFWTTEDRFGTLRAHPTRRVGGAGRDAPHYLVDGVVIFEHEDGEMDLRPVTLYVAEPHRGNVELESLLGRDILQHYVTTFDHLDGITLV